MQVKGSFEGTTVRIGRHVDYFHVVRANEVFGDDGEDSKSVPLCSPIPLWYHHKLTPQIHMKTFDYFIQKSNSALKKYPPSQPPPCLSPLSRSPLPPPPFYLPPHVDCRVPPPPTPVRRRLCRDNAITSGHPQGLYNYIYSFECTVSHVDFA